MESLTNSSSSNARARNIAKRMIEHAETLEETEQIVANNENEPESDKEEQDAENPGAIDEEFEQELLRDGDDPYDSDDPRSFGGEYYWTQAGGSNNVGVPVRLRDNCRWMTFHVYRAGGFVLLVLQHFFGLNKSRFQWAVDLVESETRRRDALALGGGQPRRDY